MKSMFKILRSICAWGGVFLILAGCPVDAPQLESVSISGDAAAVAEGTITLAADISPKDLSGITYSWTITSGSEYAFLSGSITGKTVTVKGKNASDRSQTVVIKVTATHSGSEKSNQKTITFEAAGNKPEPSEPAANVLSVNPGSKVTTYGWADIDGGMKYPDTRNIIEITDEKYPSASDKRKAFTNAIASGSVTNSGVNDAAAIIILDGTVDLSDGKISDAENSYYDQFDSSTHKRKHEDIVYKIGSNKAIIGQNGAKIAFGGLQIYAEDASSGKNIIIQNVTFWDAHGSTEYDTSASGTYKDGDKDKKYSDSKASADSLVLEAKKGSVKGEYAFIPTNIWIDHCTFTDGNCDDLIRNLNHDGSLDMKAAKNVTVSWCEFTNHDKVTLLAPNDDYVNPEDRQITFHHNYYHDATQRMPRSRGCQLHIYNNVYDVIGVEGNGGYSLGPGIGSQYIVENNYFGSFYNDKSVVQYADKSAEGEPTLSKFYQKGNNIPISNSNVKYDKVEKLKDFDTYHNASSEPWTIQYEYKSKMHSCTEAEPVVKEQAGGAYYKTVTITQ